jgi:ADP-dependent NAD(P)H-hydrate dehydratase / NAD(P)H-hydrate epimerase
MKIVTVAQMKTAEQESSRFGISLEQLMENAGKTTAEEIRRILGNLTRCNILILIGPGNNGGDGLVAARYLFDWGTGQVKIASSGKRPDNDTNLAAVLKRNIPFIHLESDQNFTKFNQWLSEADVVLDSLFGTGKSRKLEGIFAEALKSVCSVKQVRPDLNLIALDIPSGIDADSGEVDPVTPYFDYTVTLGFPKVGLFNIPAAEHTGRISIADIGLPPSLNEELNTEMMTDKKIKGLLPGRPAVSHKGTFGRVLALVGSINYPGAASLACSGAIRVGAGLTTLAIAQSLLRLVASKVPEITYLPLVESSHGVVPADVVKVLRNNLPQYNVLLVGCGIGQSQSVKETIKSILFESQITLPVLVLDADGLNNLSETADWHLKYKSQAIFTPHPAEMSRLTGISVKEIQSGRIELSRKFAQQWNKVIVLKGAYTVVAAPDGRVMVSPFANAGLASAGTGDVLAGCIAGMAAQGLPLFDAAVCGVYVHGFAAEMVKSELGDSGMLAGDLLPILPRAIKSIKEMA